MFARPPRQTLGGVIHHAKRFIGNADRTIRTVGKLYSAVKDHLPPSKIKNAAEKGLSEYGKIREAIRSNAPLL
jgi:hypothetical protein